LRERSHPIDVTAGPTKVYPHVAAIGPTKVRKGLSEHRDASLRHGIVFVVLHEHADTPHPFALLRARRDGPCRRAADERDELAPFHSMTSSARASSVRGTVMPSALAVLRLTTSSTFVVCWTGRSDGFSPLRIRPA